MDRHRKGTREPNCPQQEKGQEPKKLSRGMKIFTVVVLAWLVFAILVATDVLPIFKLFQMFG